MFFMTDEEMIYNNFCTWCVGMGCQMCEGSGEDNRNYLPEPRQVDFIDEPNFEEEIELKEENNSIIEPKSLKVENNKNGCTDCDDPFCDGDDCLPF